MKLVILGAGASYDGFCYYHDNNLMQEYLPPLANGIFSTRPKFIDIIQSYPGSLSLFNDLGVGIDIEKYFEESQELVNNYNAKELEANLINIKYFLQHLFYTISEKLKYAGFSNLQWLVKKLYEHVLKTGEEVLIVTFNYDLLLEDAIKSVYGVNAKESLFLGQYIAGKIKIFKVHGSCNWHRVFQNQNPFGVTFDSMRDFLFENKIQLTEIEKLLSEQWIVSPFNNQRYGQGVDWKFIFPQILIPYKDKDEFMLPKTHLDCLSENLQHVNEVLIIGWKGNEKKFNELLNSKISNADVDITVVNAEKENWDFSNFDKIIQTYLPEGKIEHFVDNFDVNQAGIGNEQVKRFVLKYKRDGSFTAFRFCVDMGKRELFSRVNAQNKSNA